MQRAASSELASTALRLSRAWSGSAPLPRLDALLSGGAQNAWSARAQHTNLDGVQDAALDGAKPAPGENRVQGSSASTSGARAIHSSTTEPLKEQPAPVIGTRDTCYHAAPACIDITAEIRAAADAHMTWHAYLAMQRSIPC